MTRVWVYVIFVIISHLKKINYKSIINFITLIIEYVIFYFFITSAPLYKSFASSDKLIFLNNLSIKFAPEKTDADY